MIELLILLAHKLIDWEISHLHDHMASQGEPEL